LYQVITGKGQIVFGPGIIREVYPQWFGAKGDGVNDDTFAVQSALNAISASGKGDLFFPSGTYKLGSIKIPGGIRLLGYGAMIIPNGKSPEVFKIDASAEDKSNIQVKGFTFNGSATYFINAVGGRVRFSTIEDIKVIGGSGTAIINFYHNDNKYAPSRNKIYNIDARVSGWMYAVQISRGSNALKSGVSYDNFEISRINHWADKHVVYASCPISNSKISHIYGGLFKSGGSNEAIIYIAPESGIWTIGLDISMIHMEGWNSNDYGVWLKNVIYTTVSGVTAIRVNTTKAGQRAIKVENVKYSTFRNFLIMDNGGDPDTTPSGYYPAIELDESSTDNEVYFLNRSILERRILNKGVRNQIL